MRFRSRPVPQVLAGMHLAGLDGVHAAIDVSDGLLADLGHVMKVSGVGARLDTERIPLHPQAIRYAREAGTDALGCALSGGDDYRLVAVAAPGAVPACEALGLQAVGEVTRRRGLVVRTGGKRVVAAGAGGYRHR